MARARYTSFVYSFHCIRGSWRCGPWVVDDISRSRKRFHTPIKQVGKATLKELRALFRALSEMEVEDHWLETYAKAFGYCAGYFVERAVSVLKTG
jgi:hypothetical protein